MPAVSEKQRKFMGADLARAETGEGTRTGMDASKLRDFARKPGGARGAKPARIKKSYR